MGGWQSDLVAAIAKVWGHPKIYKFSLTQAKQRDMFVKLVHGNILGFLSSFKGSF